MAEILTYYINIPVDNRNRRNQFLKNCNKASFKIKIYHSLNQSSGYGEY